jgi:GDP-L-fucose synthase
MSLQNKRITITGGKGFLGTHLIRQMREWGYGNIAIADLPEFNLVNIEDIRRLYIETRPDIVIHLAAKVGGIGFNQENPASLFYDNAMMGIQLMHEAYLHHVEKFVALGTICAYPKFTPVPFHEEDIWNGYPEETNAPYGIAKKMIMVQSQAYRQQYGFNSIFLLPVNLYGPNDNFTFRSSHVIPALIRKFYLADLLSRGDFSGIVRDFQFNGESDLLIDGQRVEMDEGAPTTDSAFSIQHSALIPVLARFGIYITDSDDLLFDHPQSDPSDVVVEVWGTGAPTREFFYAEDAAEAIILALEQYDKSEPINIGTGFEISIKDLVNILVRLTGFEGQVLWDGTKPDGQPRRMLDTTRAAREFGFRAKTGFEEGLRKTIEWYRTNSQKDSSAYAWADKTIFPRT